MHVYHEAPISKKNVVKNIASLLSYHITYIRTTDTRVYVITLNNTSQFFLNKLNTHQYTNETLKILQSLVILFIPESGKFVVKLVTA